MDSNSSSSKSSPSNQPGASRTQSNSSDSATNDRSLVEFYCYMKGYCGYCKQENEEGGGRLEFDFRSDQLHPDDYQTLLDRGWRRSGEYCYHPNNRLACCPNYPISCNALSLRFTKSLRKCVENMNSYLINGNHRNRPDADTVKLDYLKISHDCMDKLGLCSDKDQTYNCKSSRSFEEIKSSLKLRDKRFVRSCEKKMKLYNISPDDAIRSTKERSLERRNNRDYNLEDCLFPRKKAQGTTSKPLKLRHNLDIQLVYVDALSYDAENDEHSIIKKYQKAVHKEGPSNWTLEKFHDFLIDTPLIPIRMGDRDYIRPNGGNIDRKLSESVYDKDDFLVVTPPPLPTHYGTYHCLYYLDGDLIGVGVLDVLTKCITTVYFFYDPDYKHLNLGIYSALVEISMIRQMAKHYSGLRKHENKLINYHIGFYVHECKKMHYKTRFKPAYLLCSETWEYVPVEICLEKLKGKKYARFSTDPNNKFNIYDQTPTIEEIDKLRVITPLSKTPMVPSDYLAWVKSNLSKFHADLVYKNVLLPLSLVVGASFLRRLTVQISTYHRAIEIDHHKKQSAAAGKPLGK